MAMILKSREFLHQEKRALSSRRIILLTVKKTMQIYGNYKLRIKIVNIRAKQITLI
jgi:hypothetical protein